ncbi:glycosyltransferase family protein [Ovoidimarina sediminis]|uniref:glycosyltransferase family protein n=1 Tax=Ovoidimarina sediminis TaxID=3079856 RepID=UPI002913A37E|nr:glycosyltransferase [Rhodophyticola sp. MJ-SS7]MDU8946713.1 glycosyltransferase [Rhodophyticola sp. MJ-SS7]
MSVALKALRPARLRRFGAVWRDEGLTQALGRARTHLRLMRTGQGVSEVAQQAAPLSAPGHPAPPPPRFAFAPVWRDLARGAAFHLSAAPATLSSRRRVAMIGDLNLPQCRKYRVEQMDEICSGLDAGYRFAHYEDLPRCREILQEATHLMLYRLRRCDLTTMYLYEARRLRLPVLYDIDDPLFSVSAYETYSNMAAVAEAEKAHFVAEAPLYADAMNMSDLVSVSTPGLAEHARAHTARPVLVRRNFADRATLEAGRRAMAMRPARTGFTVAMASGSRGHDADLMTIRDALCRFLQGGVERRLLLLGHLDGGMFPDAFAGQIRCRPFAGYDAYLAALAEADCTVLPLTDDAFNRCKSAVRAIDAAAVGVPALVADVGDLAAVVEDRRTGCVVRSDWAEALTALAEAPAEAARMGRAARAHLERAWGAAVRAPVADAALAEWIRG